MTDSEKDEAEKQPLPGARIANRSRRERMSGPIRWLKRGLITLMTVAFIGSLVAAIVFGVRACDAKAKTACEAMNGWVIRDIMRIKRGDLGRVVYTQPPDSSAVRMIFEPGEADFVADVPAGVPMRGVRRTWMLHNVCHCSMTYHIHDITDPNVE